MYWLFCGNINEKFDYLQRIYIRKRNSNDCIPLSDIIHSCQQIHNYLKHILFDEDLCVRKNNFFSCYLISFLQIKYLPFECANSTREIMILLNESKDKRTRSSNYKHIYILLEFIIFWVIIVELKSGDSLSSKKKNAKHYYDLLLESLSKIKY